MADKHLITVNPENLSQFTHLHECIFPLKFPKKFYREAVTPTKPGIHHIAAFNDKYVGVLSACVIKEGNDDLHLYIYSLGCKVLHRKRGIGTFMLRNCIEFANNQNCKKIKLHVQQINEDAIEFYKKNGFCEGCIEQNYYKRLEKPDAVVMCKEL